MSDVSVSEAPEQMEASDGRIEVLFRSDDLLVRALDFPGNDHAFLTFESYTDNRTLERPGFGEHHFQIRHMSAAHVISRDNRWYQYPEMAAAMAVLREWSTRFHSVTAYGSSMGGFAALTFGAACGATQGFALSPQFSVDPRIVPFETRWPRETADIRFQPSEDLSKLPLQYIAFDPRHTQDARHAEMFAQRSETILIRAPMGGHPVGAFLNETALLSPLLERIAAGHFNESEAIALEHQLRGLRRSSGQYLSTLASQLSDRRIGLKVALTALAVKAQPSDPGYQSLHAAALDQAGRYAEAEQVHRAAMAIPNSGLYPACRMVTHLQMRGNLDAAEQLARDLVSTYPGAPLPMSMLDELSTDRWLQRFPEPLTAVGPIRKVLALAGRRLLNGGRHSQ